MNSLHEFDLDIDDSLDLDIDDTSSITSYEHEQITEVTEEDAERGIDVQGIEWSKFPATREEYRENRLQTYENYQNLKVSHDVISKEIKSVTSDAQFYKFKYTKLTEKCSYYHFQLRNQLWVTSKNDIFYTFYPYVRQWSPHLRTSRNVLELDSDQPNSHSIRVSTMACHEDFLLVGSFDGAYVCQRLSSQYSPASYGIISSDINPITNHIDITQGRSGATQAIISSNDHRSRIMDMETLKIMSAYPLPWPVNCTTLSPDRRMLCVVGDATDSVIANADTGEEPVDFIHIFDAKTFDRSQVIDIFGEIAGVSFTPDAESLYIANADEAYGWAYGSVALFLFVCLFVCFGNLFPHSSFVG
ncbi:hypothetical protein BC937DRAFT_87074 [Endogone sp. FLAS-F59071]|nr:hypothetical protein BC937DRAFT_87074 [Endogone sp. FLAS-F59071]|eukprot:RUS19704.1 hypothetical protein BC937DRAFT_87074 [Endogone sp. FLAS-F59071]